MGLKDRVKRNEIKADLNGRLILLLGQEKIGKTTWYSEVVKEFYGSHENGILIPFENGYGLIDGINVYEPEDGSSAISEWYDFECAVDELIEEGKDAGIEVVALDTIDRLYKVGEKEIIRLSKIETKKPCKSMNEAMGGYGKGKQRLFELVDGQIQRLKNAGFGVIVIGHTKYKSIKEKISGEEYNVLGSNLTEDYFKAIANDADFILMACLDKEIKDGVVIGDTRYLRLRSDGFYTCGTRLKGVPEKISLDAKDFINMYKETVMKQAHVSDSGALDKKIKEERVEQIKFAEKHKDDTFEDDADSLMVEFKNLTTPLSKESKLKLKDYLDSNNLGVADVKNQPTKKIKELLDFVKGL